MLWLKAQVEAGRGLFLALAVMLACALPGFFSMPPLDRDEVLFSQASRQMVASGDVVDIRFADMPRYKKPVGIYWLQALAAKATGAPDAIWSYRLVSLLAGMVAVAATHRIARGFLSAEGALLAAVALAGSVMLGIETHLAKTDATLLATVAVAMAVVADPRRPWVFWAALGVSLLVKGPLGPMVVVLAVAALCLVRRDAGLLRALWRPWGFALMLAIALPWYLAITWVSKGAFWSASLGADMLGKVAMAQESHGAPPGSYLAALWLTFWPGSMALAAALPALWRARRAPVVVFALAWAVPTFLVFEATPTKLIHYTLPAWPALALLAAAGAERLRGPALIPAGLPVVGLVALAWELDRRGIALPAPYWVGVVLVALAAALVVAALRQGTLALAAATALAGFAFNATLFPSLAATEALWPARQIAAIAAQHPGCRMTVAGFDEPSLVFAMNARVTLAGAEDLPAVLKASGCQLVAAPDLATALPEIARIRGLDLGSGDVVDLGVWLKP